MILVGENLNIMSKTLGPALKERESQPVQEMAKAEDAVGIDYLDINIGPARKGGDEFMSWVVKTVQEVTAKPLSLDTTNPVAMTAGLETCRAKALINSISLEPVRLEQELPLVSKFNADMIGLLWGTDGMPRDANERCMLAVDLVYRANEQGIPNERIWIDPIITPVCGEINQIKASLEFMQMLPEIAPGCRTIVGLSNVSNGAPVELRPYLNRTFLMMLMKYGLYAAIVDAFDAELINIARGRRPDLVQVVDRMLDGEKPDLDSLNAEEVQVAKTVRVLTGESLYSHSWLQI
ncbi:MAG: dihydropteroate synthase [Dehalococcoidales bacterium]|nr:dihydropteroate synthase [Dehalococcoidales bacterium]